MKFFKELRIRLGNSTPVFFQKVAMFQLAWAAMLVGLKALPWYSDIPTEITNPLFVIGTVLFVVVSMLTPFMVVKNYGPVEEADLVKDLEGYAIYYDYNGGLFIKQKSMATKYQYPPSRFEEYAPQEAIWAFGLERVKNAARMKVQPQENSNG